MFVVRVGKGEEVIDAISRAVADRGMSEAALTLIGAVEGCSVSVMPKADPLSDIISDYAQPFELTGTGEVSGGRVHIHVSLGGENETVAGHLHWARVGNWFVNAYVNPLST